MGEILGYTPAILDSMAGRDAAGYFETLDGVRMYYDQAPTVENAEDSEPANGKSVLSMERVAEMAMEGGFDFDECRDAVYNRMAANSFPSLTTWRHAKARELRQEAAEQWRGEIDAQRQLFRAACGIPTAENFTF